MAMVQSLQRSLYEGYSSVVGMRLRAGELEEEQRKKKRPADTWGNENTPAQSTKMLEEVHFG